MKKILLLLFSLIAVGAFSQKVDSIRIEPTGDFIKIRYRIVDSRPDQVYRVRILCSINGGLNTELRSVTGDTGDHVPGGKPEYWAVWDVLKDVDEVKSVDFIVRAELIEGRQKAGKIFNLQPSIQFPGPVFGVRTGLMGKFGVSAQFVRGPGVLIVDPLYREEPVFNRFSLDFATRLVNDGKTQLYLLTGVTVGNTVIKETEMVSSPSTTIGEAYFKKAMTPGPEIGLSLATGYMVFTVSGTKLLTGLTEEGKSISKNTYVVFSVGFRL